jgi:hypothetical protein
MEPVLIITLFAFGGVMMLALCATALIVVLEECGCSEGPVV